MIPNQWYVVLESKEVPRGRTVGVKRLGEKLVFWRDHAGRVVCQRDLCPHRGVALSAGKLLGDCIQCPFHGFEFDATGRCKLIPANGRNANVPQIFQVHTYPSWEGHGFIYIWWGQQTADIPPARFFEDIDEDHFRSASAHEPWATHYSRAIENQLDVVHLPFVHASTIGRGNATVVDGAVVKWIDPDLLFLYVFNRQDDGVAPRRSGQLAGTAPDGDFKIEFLFPNLWENHLGLTARIVVAFVPIDDENTMMYIRFYQRFVTAPLLGDLVARLSMPANLLILHQDRRVVMTQRPLRSALRMNEKLIPGDHPIVAYRRRRQELIDCASTIDRGPEAR